MLHTFVSIIFLWDFATELARGPRPACKPPASQQRLRLTCCRQMVRFCVALLVAAAAAPTAAAGKPPTLWTPCNASAGICFSRNLGSNMVLQQAPAKACLFGMLGAGGTAATVKISTSQDAAAEVAARVAADGRWKACLPPQQAGGEFRITATCTGCAHPNAAVTIENVVFGDVYYCSGQSNMALPLVHTYSRNETRDAILAGKYANIRIQGLAGNMNADQEWATLKQALVARSCKGTNCKQGTDSDSSSLMSFSATCFYFGQELSGLLGAKAPPIGLVHTAWGGSTIEQWLTNSTIDTCEFSKKSAASQEFHDTRVLPYVDMTLKGFVWYQGENDCHTVMGNSAAKAGYSCEMQALVAQWRKLWSASPGTTDPLAPFGIVTLASSGSEGASSLAMGAMRQAQTAGFGALPGPSDSSMANTFLAQAYDLDDEWSGDRGPCVATGWNISSPEHECCDNKGFVANTSTCPSTWRDKCANMCTANAGTSQYMGSIHPRSKIYVGIRLAKAAYNSVESYGGKAAYTGPTLSGCTLGAKSLKINFDPTMLRGDKVVLQKYGKPNFTPYYHGHGNPGYHYGSQLYVQTKASSFCIETVSVNLSDKGSDVYCPAWAGGEGKAKLQPAPDGRFPTFGGSGAEPISNASEFNMGWINLPITSADASSITVDLTPLHGAKPTAVKYAWGIIDCCDLLDPTTFTSKPCIANCPVMSSSGLPANPFIAKITGEGKCECVAPQQCST